MGHIGLHLSAEVRVESPLSALAAHIQQAGAMAYSRILPVFCGLVQWLRLHVVTTEQQRPP